MATTMKFTDDELLELEEALSNHYPLDDDEAETAHRLVFRVATALKRPWVKRYKDEEHAVREHMENRK